MKIFLLNMGLAFLLSVLKVVCLLVAIAYFTLAERKIMAAVQRRVGPNVVGLFGLLQPLADGLKLAGKELSIPAQASRLIFLVVSMTVLFFALIGWTAVPFGLFDHSENMSIKAVIKILHLSASTGLVASNGFCTPPLSRYNILVNDNSAAKIIVQSSEGNKNADLFVFVRKTINITQ